MTIPQNGEEWQVLYWRILGLNNWWIYPLTIHRFYVSLAVAPLQNTYYANKYNKTALPQFVIHSWIFENEKDVNWFKGTQDWEFFWLRFWNLRYFFVSYVKILRFYKKFFLIGPLLGEVRFFRAVLGLRGIKKNFELVPKKIFFLLKFWTLNMTQY